MLVYKNYTEEAADAFPAYEYRIYEGPTYIGNLFIVLTSPHEIRVGIYFPYEFREWTDLKIKHVKEIMQLIENHMIIDEPYDKIDYDFDNLSDLPL